MIRLSKPLKIEIARVQKYAESSTSLYEKFHAVPSGITVNIFDYITDSDVWKNLLQSLDNAEVAETQGLVHRSPNGSVFRIEFQQETNATRFQYYLFVLLQIEHAYMKLNELLDYARQHIFPIALSDEEKLKAPLEELLIKRKSFFSRNEIFEIIDTRRLFYTS